MNVILGWFAPQVMFRRKVRLLLNGVAIAAVLFAQAVSVAQACVTADATPAMAFVDMTGMDCDMPSPNACLQQTLSGDQNSGTAQVPVAALPNFAVLTVTGSSSQPRPTPPGDSPCLRSASDPPRSIRFCSFQL